MSNRDNWYRLLPDHSYEPCSMEEWMAGHSAKIHVGWLELPEGYVSTVWLGIDHGWDGGRPILFETMITAGDPDNIGYSRRYSTWAEAEAGHAVAVALATGIGDFKTFLRGRLQCR